MLHFMTEPSPSASEETSSEVPGEQPQDPGAVQNLASGATAGVASPQERQRIQALDVARGFALLGIFLVNIDFIGLAPQ